MCFARKFILRWVIQVNNCSATSDGIVTTAQGITWLRLRPSPRPAASLPIPSDSRSGVHETGWEIGASISMAGVKKKRLGISLVKEMGVVGVERRRDPLQPHASTHPLDDATVPNLTSASTSTWVIYLGKYRAERRVGRGGVEKVKEQVCKPLATRSCFVNGIYRYIPNQLGIACLPVDCQRLG